MEWSLYAVPRCRLGESEWSPKRCPQGPDTDFKLGLIAVGVLRLLGGREAERPGYFELGRAERGVLTAAYFGLAALLALATVTLHARIVPGSAG